MSCGNGSMAGEVMKEIFYWVLNMSVTASITGSFVMLVRLIRSIPRRLTVFLWAIPFLRMLLPVGLDSPYSLMALLSKVTADAIFSLRAVNNPYFSMTNYMQQADLYFPMTYKSALFEQVLAVASVVWLTVAMVMLVLLAMAYISTMRAVRDAEPKNGLFFSEKVTMPAVYGLFRPRVVMPISYWDTDHTLVLLHENTHVRRGDNWWRLIVLILTTIHWFNPFSWLFLKCFLTDLELACDECVLSKIGVDRRKEYAGFLLENKRKTTALISAFGGSKLRQRIENILSFKKLTVVSLAVFLPFLALLFFVLLTNAG